MKAFPFLMVVALLIGCARRPEPAPPTPTPTVRTPTAEEQAVFALAKAEVEAHRVALESQGRAAILALQAEAARYGAEADSYRRQVYINRTIPEPIPWHLYLQPQGPPPAFYNAAGQNRGWGGIGR